MVNKFLMRRAISGYGCVGFGRGWVDWPLNGEGCSKWVAITFLKNALDIQNFKKVHVPPFLPATCITS